MISVKGIQGIDTGGLVRDSKVGWVVALVMLVENESEWGTGCFVLGPS